METNWEVCRKLIKKCGRATIAWPCYEVRSRSGHAADAENKRWRRPCALAAPLYIGAPASSNQACGQPSAPTGSRCNLDCPKNFPSRSFLEQICSLHTADGLLLIPRHDSLPQGDWQAHAALVDAVHAWPPLSLGMRGYIRASLLAATCVLALEKRLHRGDTHTKTCFSDVLTPRPCTAYSDYGLVE